MSQLSSDQIFNKQSIGSASILKRAMTVKKFSEMLDCIQNLKSNATTIEQDLFNENNELDTTDDFQTENILDLAKQRSQIDRYVLLNDLIKYENMNFSTRKKQSTINNHHHHHRQIELIKCIIASQPSAFDAIYLESLLNPEQWQYNRKYLQTKPKDYLTELERKRLNEILNEHR